MIRTKSVWSPIEPEQDGLRVLATRFRGRGMPTSRYDVWLPALGPSEALLKDRPAITWAAFAREYRSELWAASVVDERCRTIRNHGQKSLLRLLKALGRRGTVTLLCHCDEDERHCHRHVLKQVIDSSKVSV